MRECWLQCAIIAFALRLRSRGAPHVKETCVMAIKKSGQTTRIILSSLFIFVIAPSANALCSSNNEPECSGFWNIYVSIPGGDRWDYDKMGRDPVSRRLAAPAESLVQRLKNCGLSVGIGNSSWIRGFRPDLIIVFSGSYASARFASTDLDIARRCGVNGYTKYGSMQVPGEGED